MDPALTRLTPSERDAALRRRRGWTLGAALTGVAGVGALVVVAASTVPGKASPTQASTGTGAQTQSPAEQQQPDPQPPQGQATQDPGGQSGGVQDPGGAAGLGAPTQPPGAAGGGSPQGQSGGSGS